MSVKVPALPQVGARDDPAERLIIQQVGPSFQVRLATPDTGSQALLFASCLQVLMRLLLTPRAHWNGIKKQEVLVLQNPLVKLLERI